MPVGLLPWIGVLEILFGALILYGWSWRSIFLANIAFMVLATVAVALNSPVYLTAAFRPRDFEFRDDRALHRRMVILSNARFISSMPTTCPKGAIMISIYQRALGSDFSKLHPQIQRRFALNSKSGIAAVGYRHDGLHLAWCPLYTPVSLCGYLAQHHVS